MNHIAHITFKGVIEKYSPTLDSGINVAPPLENFYITILILFYINLGIAVIFDFFLSSKIFKN